jgi:hypothetical protein
MDEAKDIVRHYPYFICDLRYTIYAKMELMDEVDGADKGNDAKIS